MLIPPRGRQGGDTSATAFHRQNEPASEITSLLLFFSSLPGKIPGGSRPGASRPSSAGARRVRPPRRCPPAPRAAAGSPHAPAEGKGRCSSASGRHVLVTPRAPLPRRHFRCPAAEAGSGLRGRENRGTGGKRGGARSRLAEGDEQGRAANGFQRRSRESADYSSRQAARQGRARRRRGEALCMPGGVVAGREQRAGPGAEPAAALRGGREAGGGREPCSAARFAGRRR